jgi:hypothetical protein
MPDLKKFDKRPEKLRIYRIPANPSVKPSYDEIGPTMKDLQDAIGGGYFEFVHTRMLPMVDGVQLMMVVDEDGHAKGLPYNARAAMLYPGPTGIVGDAIIVGEALVADEEQFYEPDVVGIPEGFSMIGVQV